MLKSIPPRVDDAETYWTAPPPEPSPRLLWWKAKIEAGWRPNKRIRSFGYGEAAHYYGVYIWEYCNVLFLLLYPDANVSRTTSP